MEKLMDHTLQRQMAELKAQNIEQNAKIDELTALVKQLAVGGRTPPEHLAVPVSINSVSTSHGTVNIGPTTTNVTQNVQINISPWDGERRIYVDAGHIAAAFAENPRLKEYMRLGDHELTDPEIAPPYVTELLMDLVKRAHSKPESRNVYLNPRRADQVLVHMKNGRWEVLPLQEATRMIFDGVAGTIHRVALSYEERTRLPLEAQNALSLAGLLYDDEPDEYAKRAKAPMAAHLTNTSPAPPLTEK